MKRSLNICSFNDEIVIIASELLICSSNFLKDRIWPKKYGQFKVSNKILENKFSKNSISDSFELNLSFSKFVFLEISNSEVETLI